MYGLTKSDAERIIRGSLNKNPDLKYYINNDYIDELLALLIDGVCNAIEENNKKVISDIEHEIMMKQRGAF